MNASQPADNQPLLLREQAEQRQQTHQHHADTEDIQLAIERQAAPKRRFPLVPGALLQTYGWFFLPSSAWIREEVFFRLFG